MNPSRDRAIFEETWFRLVCFVAALGMAALIWCAVCTVPTVAWNAPRLSPPFALSYGLPIYALRDSGAHLGWFYGPVFPLWYLPITITENPMIAMLLAGGWNIITLLAPSLLIFRLSGIRRCGRLAVMVLVTAILWHAHTITRDEFFYIHVDVVCRAAGLLACAGLFLAARRTRRWGIQAAALGLVAACWTKQIAFMLAPALFTWLWLERKRELLWPLFFWCAIYTAVSAAAVFVYFGGAEVLFNLWLVHARNPWIGGGALLARRVGELLLHAWPWLPFAVCATCSARRSDAQPIDADARSLIRLLLWAAAWQLPLGLSALLKNGGGLNSLHSLHYAFLSAMIVVVRLWTATGEKRIAWRLGWTSAILMPVAVGIFFAVSRGGYWNLSGARGQEQLIALVRSQPGRIYCPWNPLVTLIAERRVYPFDDALYCLWLGGLEVPADKVRAAVPPNPTIIYQQPVRIPFALEYFPRHQPSAEEEK